MSRRLLGLVFVAALCCGGCTAVIGGGGGGTVAWSWGAPGYRLNVIADTGIRFVVDVPDDIFVYGGIWYRYAGGVWYNCRNYGGAWVRISAPPAVFFSIPSGHVKYRVVRGRQAPPAHPAGPGRGHGRGHGYGKRK